MTKRAPSLSCRLARSRRTLAAFLLLGGAAMTGMAGPVAAHDHAAPTIDRIQGMAESLPQQPGDAVAPLASWTFDRWLAETYGLRPAINSAAKRSEAGSSSNPSSQPAAAASAVAPPGEGDAVGALFNANWIKSLLPWGAAANPWVTPLLPPAQQTAAENSNAPLVPLASALSLAHDFWNPAGEEAVDIGSTPSQIPQTEVDTDRSQDAAVLEENTADLAAAAEPQLATELTEMSAASEPPATAPPKYDKLALVGSSPLIVTLPDTYLAYDLSPEDLIAMRMYPIDQPSPFDSAARRTAAYGAINAIASRSWRIVSEPAVTVSTAEPTSTTAATVAAATERAEPAAPAEPSEAEQRLAVLANQIIEAVQPGSDLRNRLQPNQLGSLLGQWSQHSGAFAEGLLANFTGSTRDSVKASAGETVTQVAQAELLNPRKPNAETAAPLLPTGEGRVLQVELACQAAIEVVMAQAARAAVVEPTPALAETPTDPLTRALAVATVCDQAAASLEKLAMALRRAGDSWVRQAQIDSGNGTLLR